MILNLFSFARVWRITWAPSTTPTNAVAKGHIQDSVSTSHTKDIDRGDPLAEKASLGMASVGMNNRLVDLRHGQRIQQGLAERSIDASSDYHPVDSSGFQVYTRTSIHICTYVFVIAR